MNKGELIVDSFLLKLVKDTRENLVKKERIKAAKYGNAHNGNSRLFGSIKAYRVVKGNNTAFQLRMNNYWEFVDEGRGEGDVSETGQSSINSWIKRNALNPVKIIEEMREKEREKKQNRRKDYKYKKISFQKAAEQLTYLISRKIKNKGYEGNNFYSEILNDGRLEKVKKDYKDATKQDLINEIQQSIRKK
jgi:hypothetical protein